MSTQLKTKPASDELTGSFDSTIIPVSSESLVCGFPKRPEERLFNSIMLAALRVNQNRESVSYVLYDEEMTDMIKIPAGTISHPQE